HPQDRVLVAQSFAERGVDEVPVRRDLQPERAEVAEDDLALGRLAKDAHVGDAAVGDEVARTRRIAAVLGALCVPELRLLDLTADGGYDDVAAEVDVLFQERPKRLDVAGERALHIRDPEPVEPPVPDERLRLEAGDGREPRLPPWGR